MRKDDGYSSHFIVDADHVISYRLFFFSQGYDVHVIDVKKVAKVTKVQLHFSLCMV